MESTPAEGEEPAEGGPGLSDVSKEVRDQLVLAMAGHSAAGDRIHCGNVLLVRSDRSSEIWHLSTVPDSNAEHAIWRDTLNLEAFHTVRELAHHLGQYVTDPDADPVDVDLDTGRGFQ